MAPERASGLPELSVVLPCFEEEGSVAALAAELDGVLDRLGIPSEILFIDDASRDSTPSILQALERTRPRVRVVRHARNSGESAAQATGFRHALGQMIVTMDSDGQNDPADLPRLLEALKDADVACGVRYRREDAWLRRVSSWLANAFRNAVTGDRLADAGCTYRAIRRAALAELPVFNGMHRFLPTLLRFQGLQVVEIPVGHRPRTSGRSKYGVHNRLWRGVVDCLVVRWWRRRSLPVDRVPRESGS